MPALMDIFHGSDHIIGQPVLEYFAKYKSRDEEARARYRQIASKPVAEREIYVLDIIRNNWKNGQSI